MSEKDRVNKGTVVDPEADPIETPEPIESDPAPGFPWWVIVAPALLAIGGVFAGNRSMFFLVAAVALLAVECIALAVIERDRDDVVSTRLVHLYLAASLSLGLVAGVFLHIVLVIG